MINRMRNEIYVLCQNLYLDKRDSHMDIYVFVESLVLHVWSIQLKVTHTNGDLAHNNPSHQKIMEFV